MIEVSDWVGKAVLATAGALASALVASAFWLMRLGNRVTALETRMTLREEQRALEHAATLAAIGRVEKAATSASHAIATAREDALRFFAEDSDLKRVEVKVDALNAAVDRLSRRRTPKKQE